VAIVGAAMLDESLRRTLEIRFRQGTNVLDRILKPRGVLGDLGPKIDIAYLLYMFEKPARLAMEGIAEIRNYFAHNLVAQFDSTDRKFLESAKKLKLHEDRAYYPDPFTKQDSTIAIEAVSNHRDAFLVNLRVCLIELLMDTAKHQHGTNFPI
jgi:hypothetical protein